MYVRVIYHSTLPFCLHLLSLQHCPSFLLSPFFFSSPLPLPPNLFHLFSFTSSLFPLPSPTFHSSSPLRFVALHCTALRCTALHCTVPYFALTHRTATSSPSHFLQIPLPLSLSLPLHSTTFPFPLTPLSLRSSPSSLLFFIPLPFHNLSLPSPFSQDRKILSSSNSLCLNLINLARRRVTRSCLRRNISSSRVAYAVCVCLCVHEGGGKRTSECVGEDEKRMRECV